MTRNHPRQGRRYREAAAVVRARAARGEPCHICGLPIDLSLEPRTPMSFSVDGWTRHYEGLLGGGSSPLTRPARAVLRDIISTGL